MEAKLMAVHCHHVQEEWARCNGGRRSQPAPALPLEPSTSPDALAGQLPWPASTLSLEPSSQATTPDNLAGRLFTLTITDDGPSSDALTSKLWHSRAEFQSASPSTNTISGSVKPVSFSDIADVLSHLKVSEPTRTSTESPISLRDHTALHRPSSPPVSIISGRRVAKNERHRATVKVLKIFANIEVCIQRCFWLLLDSSDNTTNYISNEIDTLRRAIGDVKRNMESVKLRKKAVSDTLDKLELKLKPRKWMSVSPSSPIEVITGKLLYIVYMEPLLMENQMTISSRQSIDWMQSPRLLYLSVLYAAL